MEINQFIEKFAGQFIVTDTSHFVIFP